MRDSTKKELEELFEKKENYEFNSVTNKNEVENQNQTHNVKREACSGMNTLYRHR